MSKCTMCPTHQDGERGDHMVGMTACEEACPPGAIQFGNVNDDASDPERYNENPSRGRALLKLSLPSADELEEELNGADDDLESVLDAVDFAGMDGDINSNEEGLGLLLAIEITGGDGEPMDALVLAAWGLVPALVARSGFLVLEFGPVGGTEATPATNIAVVITAGAIACIWIGYCWRDGFRHAFGLERAVATPAAALGVCLCAVWFFWPWLV